MDILKYSFFIAFATLSLACEPTGNEVAPLDVKVVVVSMFEIGAYSADKPGEFQYWIERTPLDQQLDFPYGDHPLFYNEQKQVLGLCTGIGTAKSASAIMALGRDPRFNLEDAFWLVAGIAGVDPEDASVGSAIWADYVVDGDLSHEIDPREMDKDWPTGYIPLRLASPYEKPVPAVDEGNFFPLSEALTQWAFDITKDIELADSETLQGFRALYSDHPQAQEPPQVKIGSQLAAMTYWHGALLNDWANDWTAYWTNDKGNFMTSAMEDSGTLTSLAALARAGRINYDRILVLRTASNFTMQYPGITAAESLAGEKLQGQGYTAYLPSVEAAYKVGSVVVDSLSSNWDYYIKRF